MKRMTTLVLLMFLTACANDLGTTSSKRMEGAPVRGGIGGYTEMCEREPESELCNEEQYLKKK